MNCGSVLNFQVCTRWGLRPKARQIRETADWLMPVAAAIDRVDQCVSSPGPRSSSVLVITSSTCSSVIFRGAPGRGSSDRPSSRDATKRPRHLRTVSRDTPRPAATSVFERRRTRQHDPRPQRQRLRRRAPPRPARQDLALLVAQHHRFSSDSALPILAHRPEIYDSGH